MNDIQQNLSDPILDYKKFTDKKKKWVPQFFGDITQLKDCVAKTKINGRWEEKFNKDVPYWVFKSNYGAILNWWPTTGTLRFEGTKAPSAQLRDGIKKVMWPGYQNKSEKNVNSH